MRIKRILWFVFMIGLGVLLGLLYGWVFNPPVQSDTAPSALGKDYQADFILMVAEIFQNDGDLEQAARRLSLLGEQTPAQIVNEGIFTARELGYASADLERMTMLAQALQGQPDQPTPGEQP